MERERERECGKLVSFVTSYGHFAKTFGLLFTKKMNISPFVSYISWVLQMLVTLAESGTFEIHNLKSSQFNFIIPIDNKSDVKNFQKIPEKQ